MLTTRPTNVHEQRRERNRRERDRDTPFSSSPSSTILFFLLLLLIDGYDCFTQSLRFSNFSMMEIGHHLLVTLGSIKILEVPL